MSTRSGAGWVTPPPQNLRSRSPRGALLPPGQAPRPLQIQLTLSLRLPQNISGMPSAMRLIRVPQHRWRRWQRGSFCFLASAWLSGICNYFPNLHPGAPRPRLSIPYSSARCSAGTSLPWFYFSCALGLIPCGSAKLSQGYTKPYGSSRLPPKESSP